MRWLVHTAGSGRIRGGSKKGDSESRRLLEDPDSTENRDPPARRLVLVEHTMLMLKEGSQEMRTH